MRCCFDKSLPSVRIVSANMHGLQTTDSMRAEDDIWSHAFHIKKKV